jgi:hypothetical protein
VVLELFIGTGGPMDGMTSKGTPHACECDYTRRLITLTYTFSYGYEINIYFNFFYVA